MPKPDDVNSYKDLAKLTIKKLRELCSTDTKIANTTALEKPDLLDALAEAYGYDRPKQQKADGLKKLKGEIKTVRSKRDEILKAPPAERDKTQLGRSRGQIKRLKRQMRKMSKAS